MCALILPREKRHALRLYSVFLYLVLIMCSTASKASEPIQGSGQGTQRPFSPPKGMEGRVVGGVASGMHQFPYLIAITYNGGISCGGSLIKPSLVLTAAHCVVNLQTGEVITDWSLIGVRAGEHTFSVGEGFEQIDHVKRLVVHKDYKPALLVNDIALIEVDNPFNLTKAVKTVQLATPKSKYRETDCTAAGWGYTTAITKANQLKPRLDPFPDILSFVEQDIIGKNECSKYYEGDDTVSHPSLLCAGKLAGGKGTCVGDSGGPLTCSAQTSGEPMQVGVVSSGPGCAQPNSPTWYTDVAFMEPWLARAYKALEESKETIIRV